MQNLNISLFSVWKKTDAIRDEHPVSYTRYHISESLETISWVKKLKIFDADPDPGSGNLFDSGPGMGKIRIRNTAFLSPFYHLTVSLCRYLRTSCTVRMPVSTYRAVEKGTSHTDTYKVSQYKGNGLHLQSSGEGDQPHGHLQGQSV
jgi:hypothetical protein